MELTEKLRDTASSSGSDLFGHRVNVPLNTTQDYMLYCIGLLSVSCKSRLMILYRYRYR